MRIRCCVAALASRPIGGLVALAARPGALPADDRALLLSAAGRSRGISATPRTPGGRRASRLALPLGRPVRHRHDRAVPDGSDRRLGRRRAARRRRGSRTDGAERRSVDQARWRGEHLRDAALRVRGHSARTRARTRCALGAAIPLLVPRPAKPPGLGDRESVAGRAR